MAVSFEIEVVDGGCDGAIELFDRSEGAMSEEVAFEVAPGAFDVVQFGSLFRQPLDGQPGALRESSAAELAGVDGTVVEHHDDRLCRVSWAWAVERVEPLEQGGAA